MANVVITLDFDLDDGYADGISSILDGLVGVVRDHNDGVEPSLGLEVDGEHRDPDDPATDLFS